MLIAHLSDLHLRPRGELYKGLVDSNAMFDLAVRHLNTLDPEPDLVLITGDVVDEGLRAEYEYVGEALSRIRQPLIVLPGNHDERAGFRACFSHHRYLPSTGPFHFAVGDKGAVRVVGIDVSVPGRHHGEMTDEACAWLQQTLLEEPNRPTVVMMHQPPFESGITCIDAYNCRRSDRLAAILSAYTNIERLLCGHVHRFMQARFGGTMLVTAPSTTTAIALRLAPGAEPASYVEPPAFLLHHWRDDVGLVTHHVPIGSFPGPLPFF